MGAGAVVVNPVDGLDVVSTNQPEWDIAQGVVISAENVIGIESPDPLVVNNMTIGADSASGELSNNLFVLDNIDSKVFTLLAGGDVSVNSMLTVLKGKQFGIKAFDSADDSFNFSAGGIVIGDEDSTVSDEYAGVSFGVNTSGTIDVDGNIEAYGDLTLKGGSVDAGVLGVHSGNVAIESTGGVNLSQFVDSGDGDISIVAGTDIVVDGAFQKSAGGAIDLQADGNITIAGVFENKSESDTTIKADALSVTGVMTNEDNNAELTLNVNEWTVNGGDSETSSFINGGNVVAVVDGVSYFENGINLSSMGQDNVFSLDTGSLEFGSGVDESVWTGLFLNSLKSFNLVLRNSDMDLSDVMVFNGAGGNAGANISLSAQNITVANLNNSAKDMIVHADNDILVSDSVSGQANSNTDIVAGNSVTVVADVVNSGVMSVAAPQINLNNVLNIGTEQALADLFVHSTLADSGDIQIAGDIVNTYGDLNVEANSVSVAGLVENNSGNMTLSSGASMQLGKALDVRGGEVNLNLLGGEISLAGALNVSGGNLNLNQGVYALNAGDNNVQISGSLVSGNQATGTGNVSFDFMGTSEFVLTADLLNVARDVVIGEAGIDVGATLNVNALDVNRDLVVAGTSDLAVNTQTTTNVDGRAFVDTNATLKVVGDKFTVGSMLVNGKLVANVDEIIADNGNIVIADNLYFYNAVDADSGLLVDSNALNSLTLKTTVQDSVISVKDIEVVADKTLNLDSAGQILIGGGVYNQGDVVLSANGMIDVANQIINMGAVSISGGTVVFGGIGNSSDEDFVVVANGDVEDNKGNIVVENDIVNTGAMLRLEATGDVSVGSISNTNGAVLTVGANNLIADNLDISGATGTQVDLGVGNVNVSGNVNVAGDFVQGINGAVTGMLNHDAADFETKNLSIGGQFVANHGNTEYRIASDVVFGADLIVNDGAIVNFIAGNQINAMDTEIVNAGTLRLNADNGIAFASAVNNSGTLFFDSGDSFLMLDALTLNSGNLVLSGAKAYINDLINTDAMLYQNWTTLLSDKDINIDAEKYLLVVDGLSVKGINQDASLVVMTSDIGVGTEGIVADDLRFVANKNANGEALWQNVLVNGDVSGNVDFIGLEKMQISGDYLFNNNSALNVAILPYADGIQLNTTDVNYWATISMNNDKTFAQITNPTGDDAGALISVGGKFETNLTSIGGLTNSTLADAQIGVNVFDIVDAGTAIWLLHADNGIEDLAAKIRNLNVRFCNADASLCYNYLDTIKGSGSSDSDDLPVYVAERDTDGDFQIDSLYIVFDPRFGGPVEIFKIQPIVARQDVYTLGEYVSAGAIDDMVAAQMSNKRFGNRTPIEMIPLAFKGTNLSKVATELYNRMEHYVATADGTVFVPFSRLFQVREIELIAGSLDLNEHTAFRSFEDRMLDEFIWNRGRKLKKAWLDVDYGMYFQNISDGKHADGNRFSISGGYDWQATNTLMLGLTGRITHSSSDVSDEMVLSYANVTELGGVDISVANTNVGLGAYLMETVNEKARIYGNAFLDVHIFDVERMQNFVAPIEGTGTAFSLMSEWGLMHDILNQYVVGNLYARAGYNFGFDVMEKAAGSDYMKLKSDGYFIFTPGYSLIAQKRIYPSSWFQIRPYASIGVEYDVLGIPDNAKYKFAIADTYTRYDINTNPFWANIGAGVEFLAANGVQIGVDYRYQYNSALQLHNIKISGSYRF